VISRSRARHPSYALIRSLTDRALRSSPIGRSIDGVGVLGPQERKTFEGLCESWGITLESHLKGIIDGKIVPHANGHEEEGADDDGRTLQLARLEDCQRIDLHMGSIIAEPMVSSLDTARTWFSVATGLARRTKWKQTLLPIRFRGMPVQGAVDE